MLRRSFKNHITSHHPELLGSEADLNDRSTFLPSWAPTVSSQLSEPPPLPTSILLGAANIGSVVPSNSARLKTRIDSKQTPVSLAPENIHPSSSTRYAHLKDPNRGKEHSETVVLPDVHLNFVDMPPTRRSIVPRKHPTYSAQDELSVQLDHSLVRQRLSYLGRDLARSQPIPTLSGYEKSAPLSILFEAVKARVEKKSRTNP